MLHHHPGPRETFHHRTVTLMSVVVKSLEQLVLAHLKDVTGLLLDPLQFAYQANRSVDDVSTWDCTTSCNTLTAQRYHPRNPLLQTLPAHCISSHLSVDHQVQLGKALLVYRQSALVFLNDVSSPHCSSLSTPHV